MARGDKRKPDSPPMEPECEYVTRSRRRTRKRFLRHGIKSQKTKQLQKTRIHPESLDAENYYNTEDEDHHDNDVPILAQRVHNQHKKGLKSDLDDNFWHGRENPSDNRRKFRCKMLERKNVELSMTLKKSETRLGLAKRDCTDTERAYRGAMREAQGAKAELQSFEQTTKESIANCAELRGHYQDAVATYRKQLFNHDPE